jgi:hypothetical protein
VKFVYEIPTHEIERFWKEQDRKVQQAKLQNKRDQFK